VVDVALHRHRRADSLGDQSDDVDDSLAPTDSGLDAVADPDR
jgi:hypothetical protein